MIVFFPCPLLCLYHVLGAMHACCSPDRCQPTSVYLVSVRLANFVFGTHFSWGGHDSAAQQSVDYALKVAGGKLFQLPLLCVQSSLMFTL